MQRQAIFAKVRRRLFVWLTLLAAVSLRLTPWAFAQQTQTAKLAANVFAPQTQDASKDPAQPTGPQARTAGAGSKLSVQQAQTPGAAQKATAPQTQVQKTAGQPAAKASQQAKTPPQVHLPPGMRTLSLTEGRAIVQKMIWVDDEEGLSPDCSHLVHTLYEQAGYPYTYANSLELYSGAIPFVRVRAAHPGDLIVWRGHVGIVINPKDHSFFGSTSSGTRIEHYDTAYWRARGYARFFRYVTSNPAPAKNGAGAMSVMNLPPEQPPKAEASRGSTANRPGLQEVKTAPTAASKARGELTAAAHTEAASPNATHSEATPSSAAHLEAGLQVPLRTGGKQPKAADVTSALRAANLDAGEILRTGDLWQMERPVVVYRELQVGTVEVKGKRGTAKVQVETVATLSAKRMEAQQGREEHQLELQQTKKGWMMTLTNQNAYVPRDAALRILAGRLALLTQAAETSAEKEREQGDIIRFMNLLIE